MTNKVNLYFCFLSSYFSKIYNVLCLLYNVLPSSPILTCPRQVLLGTQFNLIALVVVFSASKTFFTAYTSCGRTISPVHRRLRDPLLLVMNICSVVFLGITHHTHQSTYNFRIIFIILWSLSDNV